MANLTQRAKRLRLEAAAIAAKEVWQKKAAAAAATERPAPKKIKEASALDAQAKYRRLQRRLRRKGRGDKGAVAAFLDMF